MLATIRPADDTQQCHHDVVLGRRWVGVPRPVQFVAGAEVLLFGYGAAVHVVQLGAGGLHPYPWAPTWLAIYFTSLTLADPMAAVLLCLRRTSGLYLGAAVLVTDALANGYAIYELDGGTAMARASQVIISLMAVASLALAPRVRPWLSPYAGNRLRTRTPGPLPSEPEPERRDR